MLRPGHCERAQHATHLCVVPAGELSRETIPQALTQPEEWAHPRVPKDARALLAPAADPLAPLTRDRETVRGYQARNSIHWPDALRSTAELPLSLTRQRCCDTQCARRELER